MQLRRRLTEARSTMVPRHNTIVAMLVLLTMGASIAHEHLCNPYSTAADVADDAGISLQGQVALVTGGSCWTRESLSLLLTV